MPELSNFVCAKHIMEGQVRIQRRGVLSEQTKSMRSDQFSLVMLTHQINKSIEKIKTFTVGKGYDAAPVKQQLIF